MFLLVNFNAELISSPSPAPATDTAVDTHPKSVKEVNHNNVLEAEPLAHLARFVANFLSEKVGAGTGTGATKSFANLCVITLPPPVPEQHSPSLSPRQKQKLSNEDEAKSGRVLDYNQLGEDLLVAAGLASAAFFKELRMPLTTPPPISSGSGKPADYEWRFDAENEGAGAGVGAVETDDLAGKWKDRGAVVIIPPRDPVLSLFIAHALMHILHEGLMWSQIYIITDPFSTPPKIAQWD